MPVDANLKEMCDLLLTATRNGLLKWERGVVDQIVVAKLGKTHFMINADEPLPHQVARGEDDAWLITLDVREKASESIFEETLNGANPDERDGIALLREVWQAADASRRQGNSERLRPVVESLRQAIAGSR